MFVVFAGICTWTSNTAEMHPAIEETAIGGGEDDGVETWPYE